MNRSSRACKYRHYSSSPSYEATNQIFGAGQVNPFHLFLLISFSPNTGHLTIQELSWRFQKNKESRALKIQKKPTFHLHPCGKGIGTWVSYKRKKKAQERGEREWGLAARVGEVEWVLWYRTRYCCRNGSWMNGTNYEHSDLIGFQEITPLLLLMNLNSIQNKNWREEEEGEKECRKLREGQQRGYSLSGCNNKF